MNHFDLKLSLFKKVLFKKVFFRLKKLIIINLYFKY